MSRCYVATFGPITMYITRDPPFDARASNAEVRGWEFVVEEVVDDGRIRPLYDSWERTFLEISRYPGEYVKEDLKWIESDTGKYFSLDELRRRYTID